MSKIELPAIEMLTYDTLDLAAASVLDPRVLTPEDVKQTRYSQVHLGARHLPVLATFTGTRIFVWSMDARFQAYALDEMFEPIVPLTTCYEHRLTLPQNAIHLCHNVSLHTPPTTPSDFTITRLHPINHELLFDYRLPMALSHKPQRASVTVITPIDNSEQDWDSSGCLLYTSPSPRDRG